MTKNFTTVGILYRYYFSNHIYIYIYMCIYIYTYIYIYIYRIINRSVSIPKYNDNIMFISVRFCCNVRNPNYICCTRFKILGNQSNRQIQDFMLRMTKIYGSSINTQNSNLPWIIRLNLPWIIRLNSNLPWIIRLNSNSDNFTTAMSRSVHIL